MPLRLNPTFAAELQQATGAPGASDAQATGASGAGTAAGRTLYGGWVSSGSPTMAEIMAGAGLDWLLIDMEHTPNSLEAVLHQLYAVSAYPTTPVVRVPVADATIIKQVLDLGAQNILVPMVSTRAEAEAVAAAAQYPPAGVRGVGSALARSARWNRVPDYLTEAAAHVSVFVQIETRTGVENAAAIASTPGIDGVFVGPSDLAASMGHLGQQTHPEVVAAVRSVLAEVRPAPSPVSTPSTRTPRAPMPRPVPSSSSSALMSRSSPAGRRSSPRTSSGTPRTSPGTEDAQALI